MVCWSCGMSNVGLGFGSMVDSMALLTAISAIDLNGFFEVNKQPIYWSSLSKIINQDGYNDCQANQSMEEILKNSSTSNSGSVDGFDKVLLQMSQNHHCGYLWMELIDDHINLVKPLRPNLLQTWLLAQDQKMKWDISKVFLFSGLCICGWRSDDDVDRSIWDRLQYNFHCLLLQTKLSANFSQVECWSVIWGI